MGLVDPLDACKRGDSKTFPRTEKPRYVPVPPVSCRRSWRINPRQFISIDDDNSGEVRATFAYQNASILCSFDFIVAAHHM